MAVICCNWLSINDVGLKWLEIAKEFWKCLRFLEMAGTAGNSWKCWKLRKMPGKDCTGWAWLEMARIGLICLEMAGIVRND